VQFSLGPSNRQEGKIELVDKLILKSKSTLKFEIHENTQRFIVYSHSLLWEVSVSVKR